MSDTAPKLTFPQSRRMKTPADFDRCYKRKRSASNDVLIIYACENGLDHPRLGCSVSKKVGNAVVRNRYKRLFREAFRLAQHELPPGVDLILIPRPGEEPTLAQVRESLVKLAKQAAGKLGDARKSNPLPAGPGVGSAPLSILPTPFPRSEGEKRTGEGS